MVSLTSVVPGRGHDKRLVINYGEGGGGATKWENRAPPPLKEWKLVASPLQYA